MSNLVSVKDRPEYKVSNTGFVVGYSGVQMTPQLDKGGYLTVLFRRGKPKHYKIHRLVAEAFVPNPKSYPHVNHLDGDKTNNNASNLEWCDRSINQKHAFRIGLNSNAGIRNSRAVMLDEDVKLMRFLFLKGLSRKQLSVEFKTSISNVDQITKRKTWTHI